MRASQSAILFAVILVEDFGMNPSCRRSLGCGKPGDLFTISHEPAGGTLRQPQRASFITKRDQRRKYFPRICIIRNDRLSRGRKMKQIRPN